MYILTLRKRQNAKTKIRQRHFMTHIPRSVEL
jgi:hypothetical protein